MTGPREFSIYDGVTCVAMIEVADDGVPAAFDASGAPIQSATFEAAKNGTTIVFDQHGKRLGCFPCLTMPKRRSRKAKAASKP
jgi:hypothetical protein